MQYNCEKQENQNLTQQPACECDKHYQQLDFINSQGQGEHSL